MRVSPCVAAPAVATLWASVFKRVVLPEPEGPMIAISSPAFARPLASVRMDRGSLVARSLTVTFMAFHPKVYTSLLTSWELGRAFDSRSFSSELSFSACERVLEVSSCAGKSVPEGCMLGIRDAGRLMQLRKRYEMDHRGGFKTVDVSGQREPIAPFYMLGPHTGALPCGVTCFLMDAFRIMSPNPASSPSCQFPKTVP